MTDDHERDGDVSRTIARSGRGRMGTTELRGETSPEERRRGALLLCGVLSSFLYLFMNLLVPLLDEGYHWVSQTVSELSAIGAPTRTIWVPLGLIYAALVTAFGVGVWSTARDSWWRRLAAAALVMNGVLGLAWPPMHQRDVIAAGGGTLTDTLHLVWAMLTLALMLVTIAGGAASLGARFRRYSVVTLAIFLVFGALTGIEAPGIDTGGPTPWIGVWERVNIAAFMAWVVVFAIALMRAPPPEPQPGDRAGESRLVRAREGALQGT